MQYLIPAVVALTLICSSALYVFVHNKSQTTGSTNSNNEQSTIQNQATSTPMVHEQSSSDIIWLDTPIERIDLRLITIKNEYADDQNYEYLKNLKPKYYTIGHLDGREIVISLIPCEGMCLHDHDGHVFFIQNEEKTGYLAIPANSSLLENAFFKISDDIFGTDISLSQISSPTNIPIGDYSISRSDDRISINSNSYVDLTLQPKLDTQWGRLYQVSYPSSGNKNMHKIYYRLMLPAGMYRDYYIHLDFIDDAGIPAITWNDGAKNTDAYRADGMGNCGSEGAVAVLDSKSFTENNLIITGTTSTQKPVYEFKSAEHPIVLDFYNATGGKIYSYDDTTKESSATDMSKDFFLKHHGLFLYKNDFGQYIAFGSLKYGPSVECGKPVIYLYPTSNTILDVSVGARITKSEPFYDKGWHEVEATPSGTLTYQDKKYDYLFWEGLGNGIYPQITKGVIVSKNVAVDTIAKHLQLLGLNDRESKDFLDFWASRIPDTKFVKISWLGTQEMNALAPLTISQKPDTIIRIFLDMEGVDDIYPIEKQYLTSIPRVGFTVVEWGGLLRPNNMTH